MYKKLKWGKTCLLSLFRLSCSLAVSSKTLADSKPIRRFLVLAILGALTYTTQTPITIHIGLGTGMRKGG